MLAAEKHAARPFAPIGIGLVSLTSCNCIIRVAASEGRFEWSHTDTDMDMFVQGISQNMWRILFVAEAVLQVSVSFWPQMPMHKYPDICHACASSTDHCPLQFTLQQAVLVFHRAPTTPSSMATFNTWGTDCIVISGEEGQDQHINNYYGGAQGPNKNNIGIYPLSGFILPFSYTMLT